MALMTAAALREAIPELTGTAEDTKLDTLISRFDAAAARYCGMPAPTATGQPTFDSTSYTLYLTGSGGYDLFLPLRAVTAITSIYDDSSHDFTSSTYLVASGDYTIRYDPARGQFVHLSSTSTHGTWSTGKGDIRVIAVAGYASGAAPGDILEAARIGILKWWDGRKNRNKASVSGQASASYLEIEQRHFLCDEVRLLLGPFRLPGALIGGGWG